MGSRRNWAYGMLLVCAACGDPDPIDPLEDAGVDASVDASFDASNDDAGLDSGPLDAGTDAATIEWAPYRTDRDHSPITPSIASNLSTSEVVFCCERIATCLRPAKPSSDM